MEPSPGTSPSSTAQLQSIVELSQEFARGAYAGATLRAYESDLRTFAAWCAPHGLSAIPATSQTVVLYISDLAATRGYRPSTMSRHLVAIRQAHRLNGRDDPTAHPAVAQVVKGMRRTLGVAPEEKAPISVAQLRQMVSSLPATKQGLRDRALLLTGFAGGFRRAELVALNRGDLRFEPDGITITVRRSKTDQTGRTRPVGITLGEHPGTCPVRAMQAWLEAAGIERGPVFRRMRRGDHLGTERLLPASVATIVKTAAARAGIDPASVSGHSLRAGFVTAAARAGEPEWSIMRQTGHRSHAMVQRYIRDATALRDSPARNLGL